MKTVIKKKKSERKCKRKTKTSEKTIMFISKLKNIEGDQNEDVYRTKNSGFF